jgi:hypothetical protein
VSASWPASLSAHGDTRFQAACLALPGSDSHQLIAPACLAPSCGQESGNLSAYFRRAWDDVPAAMFKHKRIFESRGNHTGLVLQHDGVRSAHDMHRGQCVARCRFVQSCQSGVPCEKAADQNGKIKAERLALGDHAVGRAQSDQQAGQCCALAEAKKSRRTVLQS